ncbi:MAG TPA: cytochrome oxidase assembly protein [Actinomycetales bacterium]|nr:cytochrome oxidase assembly protein [Actinomycetales bacterium]
MTADAAPRPDTTTAPPVEVGVRPDHLVDRVTWRLAIANLAAQIGIIVTGGAVRLTGSGLGCSEWPLCEPGQFTPVFHEATSYHPFVEFGNRTLTGVLVLIAGLLLIALYRREPVRSRPPIFRALAWAVVAGIAIQALVGGFSVWWDLHPAIVGGHMYISLGLVATSAYLVARLRQEDGPAAPPAQPLRSIVWALVVVAAALSVFGVITTGTGPHSGDENAPYRFALDPVMITRVHSLSVWLFAILLAAAVFFTVRSGHSWRIWLPTIVVTALQGVVGYTQYFNGLPILLVGIHMLLAALFVAVLAIAVTQLHPRAVAADRRAVPAA